MTESDTGVDQEHRFDVALSFAGEQRDYVEAVASALREAGLSVFYDEYHKVELWGKDLYSHLDRVYREEARFCILFLSSDYADKVWTKHERRSAQARAFREHTEYVLPVRFDDTQIEGIPETVGYFDVSAMDPAELAQLTIQKVGPAMRPRISDGLVKYFESVEEMLDSDYYWHWAAVSLDDRAGHSEDDPVDDIVDDEDLGAVDGTGLRAQATEWLETHDSESTELPFAVAAHTERWAFLARSLYQDFTRMTREERLVVGTLFAYGCPGELPSFVHLDPVALLRYTGLDEATVLKCLSDVRSLGFDARRREPAHQEPDQIVADDAYDLTISRFESSIPEAEDATVAAKALLSAVVATCCFEHGLQRLGLCDFSAA